MYLYNLPNIIKKKYNAIVDLSKIKKIIKFEQSDFVNGMLKFDAVLKKFQSIAVSHAENVGMGFYKMLEQNLLWVTLRIKYQITNLPQPNEELVLTTFASGRNIVEFDRDFIIESERGILIKGTSKWCLIDNGTRKLAKMTALSPFDNLLQPTIFDEKFLKTEIFETENMLPEFEYIVNKNDIDRNEHMNNTVYAKILQNSVIKFENYNFFQINFLKEAFEKSKILIYSKSQNQKTIYIGKFENGEISFTAEVGYANK